jgi:hypothetical protein
MFRARVRRMKTMAMYFVALASFASKVRALFLDKNVSAPPAMAPLMPAVFPDWDNTTTVRITAKTSCKMVIMVLNMNLVLSTKLVISHKKQFDTKVMISYENALCKQFFAIPSLFLKRKRKEK